MGTCANARQKDDFQIGKTKTKYAHKKAQSAVDMHHTVENNFQAENNYASKIVKKIGIKKSLSQPSISSISYGAKNEPIKSQSTFDGHDSRKYSNSPHKRVSTAQSETYLFPRSSTIMQYYAMPQKNSPLPKVQLYEKDGPLPTVLQDWQQYIESGVLTKGNSSLVKAKNGGNTLIASKLLKASEYYQGSKMWKNQKLMNKRRFGLD